jgi:hypothetical protein
VHTSSTKHTWWIDECDNRAICFASSVSLIMASSNSELMAYSSTSDYNEVSHLIGENLSSFIWSSLICLIKIDFLIKFDLFLSLYWSYHLGQPWSLVCAPVCSSRTKLAFSLDNIKFCFNLPWFELLWYPLGTLTIVFAGGAKFIIKRYTTIWWMW